MRIRCNLASQPFSSCGRSHHLARTSRSHASRRISDMCQLAYRHRDRSRPRSTKPISLPLLPAKLLNAINVFLSTLLLSCNLPRIASASAAKAKYVTYSRATTPVTRFTLVLFAPRLLPSNGSPNDFTSGAPDLRSIPNAFARILEGNLVAARETLTYLLGQGTQSTRRLQTRLVRMCPSTRGGIGDSIRAMLPGASLAPRFWPFAFYHFLRLDSMTNYCDQVNTP
jgi:hypothetical protein